MAEYRPDPDMAFLKNCDNEDLELLVSILTVDPKDGSTRYAETLTGTYEYRLNRKNCQAYWQKIAAELQTFGAHSGMTLLRGGKGVPYREILIDVCKKTKTTFDKTTSIERIEHDLLMSVLEKSLEKMNQDDLKKLAAELGNVNPTITPSVVMMAIQQSIMISPAIWNYLALTILQQLGFNVGKIMATMTATVLPRTLPILGILTGPIGWALSSLWLVSDIAGPAYRVTMPACLYVASLRKKQNALNIK